jgi:hypothetical protein
MEPSSIENKTTSPIAKLGFFHKICCFLEVRTTSDVVVSLIDIKLGSYLAVLYILN